ncbi:hypothetical protein BDV93DRAFT_264768 [Ceratobasidium sp. AG-I]|nr:hypothetical protein BDV93DRAFT_264768 [Ceratobasidium sp. AG-I]
MDRKNLEYVGGRRVHALGARGSVCFTGKIRARGAGSKRYRLLADICKETFAKNCEQRGRSYSFSSWSRRAWRRGRDQRGCVLSRLASGQVMTVGAFSISYASYSQEREYQASKSMPPCGRSNARKCSRGKTQSSAASLHDTIWSKPKNST